MGESCAGFGRKSGGIILEAFELSNNWALSDLQSESFGNESL